MTAGRRRFYRSWIFWGAIAIPFVILLAIFISYQSINKQIRFNPDASSLFIVKKGLSIRGVFRELNEQGYIGPVWALTHYYNRHYAGQAIKAGAYRFPEYYRQTSLLELLLEGSSAYDKITFPEGLTAAQMAAKLEEAVKVRADDFLRAVNDPELARELGVAGPGLEGYLFPDTYQIFYYSEPQEIIRMMVGRFREVLKETAPSLDDKRELHKIVIMASLVEREAQVEAERGVIASAFYNRLAKDYKLQCDPTVRYALACWTETLDESDLEVDSPYNTYKYYGLPVGPICNPGRASLAAAVHPENTSYLYFVANPDGTHTFSKTLKEHNKAVSEIRLDGEDSRIKNALSIGG